VKSKLAIWLAGTLAMLPLVSLAQQPTVRPLTLKEKAAKYGSIREIHGADGLPIPIEEVVRKAEVIVIGAVIDSKSRLSETGYVVLSDYKVQVGEIVKDATGQMKPGSELTFTKIGGVVTDSISRIEYIDPNTPRLMKSQTYLLIGIREGGMLKLYGPALFRILRRKATCESKNPQSFAGYCDSGKERLIAFLNKVANEPKFE
jgi:hypothetical protein